MKNTDQRQTRGCRWDTTEATGSLLLHVFGIQQLSSLINVSESKKQFRMCHNWQVWANCEWTQELLNSNFLSSDLLSHKGTQIKKLRLWTMFWTFNKKNLTPPTASACYIYKSGGRNAFFFSSRNDAHFLNPVWSFTFLDTSATLVPENSRNRPHSLDPRCVWLRKQGQDMQGNTFHYSSFKF